MVLENNDKRKYRFCDYDSDWAERFAGMRIFLREVFGGKAARIEHFGSTAVAGMKAKPVIDVVVAVKKMEEFLDQRKKMIAAGYERRENYIAPKTQLFFKTDAEGNKTENIHICESGSPTEMKFLAMRDFLRLFPKKAKEYSDLKEKNFIMHPDDYIAYRDAKASFLADLEREALQWRESKN